jgi:RimJ/RimL family protein N-acetyltransferase
MARDASEDRIEVNPVVHLSAIVPSDRDALVAYLNDREIYDSTLRIPYPYTEDAAEKFLAITDEACAKYGQAIHFAIRTTDRQLIGGIGFDSLVPEHCAELGYWLARPFWRQGIMTSAVRAVCSFAIERWELVRISAHVFDDNLASVRVLEKNQFQLEGVLRKCYRKNGQFRDARLYALVR